MILGYETIKTKHTRKSKLGNFHDYYRSKTIIKLRCDSCMKEFQRNKGAMDPNRLSNNYYHVCNTCDNKRFAQKKGTEKRNIWNMPVSSLTRISRL